MKYIKIIFAVIAWIGLGIMLFGVWLSFNETINPSGHDFTRAFIWMVSIILVGILHIVSYYDTYRYYNYYTISSVILFALPGIIAIIEGIFLKKIENRKRNI